MIDLRRIRSFGAKVAAAVTITTGLAVLLVSVILVGSDYVQSRREAIAIARSETRIIGINSEAPLSFDDAQMGAETLAALKAVPNVASANLYRRDGNLFVGYNNPELRAPAHELASAGVRDEGNWIYVTEEIHGPTEQVGYVQVAFDMSGLRRRALATAVVALVVAGATTLIAYFAAGRIRRFLTKPVAELASTAQRVSKTRDYSLRAAKYSEDELGQLTDVFNQMLIQIERQSGEIESRQKQFRIAVEAAPNAMVMVDEHGVILLVNTQTERLFGYSREELIGQSVEILVPEQFRSRHPDFRETFFSEPKARPMGAGRDLFGRHKDGHLIPVEIGLSPINTDEGVRVLSSIVDITERKRTEEDTARLAAIVQYSNDAIISKSMDGIITSFNPAAERMYGYKAKEVIGKPVAILIPPDRPDELPMIMEKLRHEQPIVNYETVRRRKDGTLIEVSVTISPTRSADGRLIGASAVARDITERRRVEQERQHLLEAERVARGEAERASRLKDEFVATLSHELRTPVSAILGWAQMLRSGNVPPTSEESAKGLEVIERNARLQTRMIEDLLDMSRIISGKIRLDVQSVNLADVIQAALATVRPAAAAKGIRLEAVLDSHAGLMRGDPSRLQQIIWNLLSNAIKFTGRDGRVQVGLERVNSHIEVVVSDTGEGFKPEFAPYLFERFRQADSSSTRRHSGLGLGLAIVKQLVELHGGTVTAHSPGEGKGSSFIVSLPLMVIHPREDRTERLHPRVSVPAADGLQQPSLAGLKALVIDDERDARELVGRLLEQQKVRVASASSADEGLELFNSFHPDVVISDIGMPDVDGYELIRRLRALEVGRSHSTPALALTAFARSEDRTRALLAGYQMHLAKPVEPSELIATIASLAGKTMPS